MVAAGWRAGSTTGPRIVCSVPARLPTTMNATTPSSTSRSRSTISFGEGAGSPHRERTLTQRGRSPIVRIDDGDGLRPEIGGVEYEAVDVRDAERTASGNRPHGHTRHSIQSRPTHYPRRYLVLDVDVDDHAGRETRARDSVRRDVRNRVRGGRASVGGCSSLPSRQGGAGGQRCNRQRADRDHPELPLETRRHVHSLPFFPHPHSARVTFLTGLPLVRLLKLALRVELPPTVMVEATMMV